VFTLPWGPYYDELIANTAAFGIASAASCITAGAAGASVCPDPQHFVFWDPLHPTTAAHRVVGYRLAIQGWPHFTCPASTRMGTAGDGPGCRFLSAADGTFSEAASPGAACTRLAFRQHADMCNNCTAPPWNGELNQAVGNEWIATYVDGRNRPGSTRLRVTSQTGSELLLYDGARNLYTRFDLAARKGSQRRGTDGDWIATSDIVSTDCR